MKGFILSEFDVAPTLSDEFCLIPHPGRRRGRRSGPLILGQSGRRGSRRGDAEGDVRVRVPGSSSVATTPAPSRASAAAVTGYSEGDAVFGFVTHANPTVHDGSWAQHISVQQGLLGRAPANSELSTLGAAHSRRSQRSWPSTRSRRAAGAQSWSSARRAASAASRPN